MNKKHMRGVIDPITVAFILSIAVSATALTFHPSDSTSEAEQHASADQVEMAQQAKLVSE